MSTLEAGQLPEPTIERLVVLFQTVRELISQGIIRASSAELGKASMIPAYNVRKDLSYLPSSCGTGSGYELELLKDIVQTSLGLAGITNACVVGLGHIGSAILSNDEFLDGGYRIAAGFDSNINKLELMKTIVPLYPAHEIPQRVRSMHIRLAVLAVPANAAQLTAQRLVEGGIQGIINFTQVALTGMPGSVHLRDISVLKELRILSAMSKFKPYAREAR